MKTYTLKTLLSFRADTVIATVINYRFIHINRKVLICTLLTLLSFIAKGQSITISTPSTIICTGATAIFTATTTIPTVHYSWYINGLATGPDSAILSINTLNNGDSILCILKDATYTNIDTSNAIEVSVVAPPDAGIILAVDTSVCVGAAITLSSSVTGGTWLASNEYASVLSGTVTGQYIAYYFEGTVVSGIDTIYYVVSNNGCSDSSKQVITTNAIQPAGLRYADALCVGAAYDLEDINHNVGLLSTAFGYAGIYLKDVVGVSEGTDYLYNVTINACGSDTARMRIGIHDKPAQYPIYGPSEVCVGATVTLLDSTSGYLNWTTSNNNAWVTQFYPGFKGGEVTGIDVGSDTIILSSWNNCGTVSMTFVIKVNPPGPITGLTSVCESRSISLSNATPGGIWKNYDPGIGSFDPATYIFTGNSEGTDTLFYEFPNGCSVKTGIRVDHTPGPLSQDQYVCLGAELELTIPGNGVWAFNTPDILEIKPFYPDIITAVNPGTVVLQYTLPTGCFTTLPLTVVNCNADLKIFPSPAKNTLVIQTNSNSYNTYSIFNTSGQFETNGDVVEKLTTIDITRLPNGVHFIKFSGRNHTTLKFVKE